MSRPIQTEPALTAARILRRSTQDRAERFRVATLRRLGAELELHALARGLSAAELAKRAKVKLSRVLAAFEGDDITLNELVRICMTLGVRALFDLKKSGPG